MLRISTIAACALAPFERRGAGTGFDAGRSQCGTRRRRRLGPGEQHRQPERQCPGQHGRRHALDHRFVAEQQNQSAAGMSSSDYSSGAQLQYGTQSQQAQGMMGGPDIRGVAITDEYGNQYSRGDKIGRGRPARVR